MPNVTMIPATKNKFTALPVDHAKKRRVAGYARVSTDSEEQLTSYEAQVDYYTNYIRSNPDWEFVEVYTDEGISAVNTKRRDGFNRMIQDAMNGRIDLIVTKSVSRFARNTVDSLTTIRKLKGIGCECYFQKENIYTFDGKGELLLTIMSSLAQEESRSISENVTWGQRKRFADGKVNLPYRQFLGYRKGTDGLPEIVPEEAAIVRRIYALFMDGKTTCGIAKILTAEGVPTPAGKKQWHSSTVESILTNEKYKGDALLQKAYTVDFLTKEMRKNTGEVPQYYVENSHPAIIPPQEWKMVQAEFKRRKEVGRHYSGNSPFASRLVCSECGTFLGSKVWHSNDPYYKVVWRCSSKHCATLDEEAIKIRFLNAYSTLLQSRTTLLADCETMRSIIADVSTQDEELTAQLQEQTVVAELVRQLVADNSRQAQNQDAYNARYESLAQRYEATSARIAALEKEKAERQQSLDAMEAFMTAIRLSDGKNLHFDHRTWQVLIEKAIVHPDGAITFCFVNGTEIEA